MSEVMGAQIRPLFIVLISSMSRSGRRRGSNLVYRTRNAIWASVIDSAAMIRSPSFSRSCESRTTMN